MIDNNFVIVPKEEKLTEEQNYDRYVTENSKLNLSS